MASLSSQQKFIQLAQQHSPAIIIPQLAWETATLLFVGYGIEVLGLDNQNPEDGGE